MTARLILRPQAQKDITTAVAWYESERPGLGRRFLLEMGESLDRIRETPFQFPEIGNGVRRALLGRFPYAAYFVFRDQRTTILAVLHFHRDPRTWQKRTR